MIELDKLPENHPLRNTPLADIGTEFKHPQWDQFRPIERGRPLADSTYNTLSEEWIRYYKWRVPADVQTTE
jgi:hypothetical protein